MQHGVETLTTTSSEQAETPAKRAPRKSAPKKAATETVATKTAATKAVATNGAAKKTAKAPAFVLPPLTADQIAENGRIVAAMLGQILESLDGSKAEDILAIDLRGKTSLADHMIVATGRSDRHVGAIAHHVIEKLKEDGHGMPRVEGMPHCDWVLVDANDIIIHIFRPEVRQFYNLEKMWSGDRPAENAL